MNRIHRRVWSTARQCWVVASELSKSQGKASQMVGAGALAAALMLATAAVHAEEDDLTSRAGLEQATQQWAIRTAFAVPADSPAATAAPLYGVMASPITRQVSLTTDYNYRDSTVSGDLLVVLGSRSTLSGNRSVAYGSLITSRGDNNTAIGNGVQITSGGYATGVGASAVASGVGTTALGNNAGAYAQNSIAVGSGSRTHDGAGISRIAIGGDAYAGAAGWTGAIALGGLANASHDSVAVGYEARTTASGSVALGRGALANEANSVSVGNASTKRRVVNVADARVTSASTDAVNGRQLYAVSQTATTALSTANTALASSRLVTQASSSSTIRVGADNTGAVLDIANRSGTRRRIQNIANGVLSASSTDAVTGSQLHSTNLGVAAAKDVANAASLDAGTAKALVEGVTGRLGSTSIALGGSALADGDFATAMGHISIASGERAVAMGVRSQASGKYANALGSGAQATADEATALGRDTRASAASSTAVGNLAVASHANAVALGTGSVTASANSVSVGSASSKRRIQYVDDGNLAANSTDAVTGSQLHATNTNVTKAQGAASDAHTAANLAQGTAEGAVTRVAALEGLVGQVSATGNVRLGAQNTGTVLDVRNKSNANRRVSGVADATLSSTSTDAVTGKQLNATNAAVSAAQNTATAAQSAAGAAQRTADGVVARATALEGLVGQTSANGNVRLGVANTGTTLDVRNQDNRNRTLTGLASAVLDGTSTEAVAGKQLYATNQLVDSHGQVLALHGQQLSGHAQQLLAQDGRIALNRTDLDKLREDVDNFDPELDGVVKFSGDRSLVDMNGARVIGVAPGDISSAASTEAVNGGQLYATNRRVSVIEEQNQYVSIGRDAFSERAESSLFGTAIGDSAKASPSQEGGTAVGAFATANAMNSVAVGRGSYVEDHASNGFAMGVGARSGEADSVALGAYSRVQAGATSSLALGAYSVSIESDTVSFGHEKLQRRLTQVARGKAGSDATSVAQLDESLVTLGGGAGMDTSGRVVAPTYNMQGSIQRTVGDALMTLDGAVVTAGTRVDRVESQLRATFQDTPSTRSDGLNQLNLAGTNGMVLGNVANGLIAQGSRDAVNGGQLYAAEQKIERNRSDLDGLREQLVGGAGMQAMDAPGPIDFAGARLSGVADGRLESGSSDVVTGRQLYDTNRSVERLAESSSFLKFGDSIDRVPAMAGRFAIAMGDSAEASLDTEGAVALGAYAVAAGTNSVALGRASHVHEGAARGFALGTESQVAESGAIAIGAASAVLRGAVESVAIGAQSVARDSHTVSFGNDGMQRRLVNVANGRNANDAATVGQLRGALATLGSDVDANGNIVGPTFTVQGGSQHTLGDALSALDGAVITNGTRVDRVENQLRSVFQDSPATRRDGLNQLNLAGANGMVLGNVANGLIAPGSRDAVNGGQLHAMEQRLDGRIDGLEQRVGAQPEGRALAAANAPTPPAAADDEGPASASGDPVAASADRAGGNIASADGGGKPAAADAPPPSPQVDTAELEKMLARANEYTDGAIRGVEQRLDKMDKRFNRMAAMSSAQTAMAMNTAGLATYNRLGAGVGYAEGESAMAVGYQRVLNERGSATFSLNGAFTNSGEQSVGLGVGIGW
ncbi:ESPR-type extended signal peptide-containing protein [Stenotrophomonas rhizophila]